MEVFLGGINELRRIYTGLGLNDRTLATQNLKNLIHNLKFDSLPSVDTIPDLFPLIPPAFARPNLYSLAKPTAIENLPESPDIMANISSGSATDVHQVLQHMEIPSKSSKQDPTEALDTLRKQLETLKSEKEALETKILQLEKKISAAEAEDPDTIVKKLLNDIILKVVPDEVQVKRGRGRPRGSKTQKPKVPTLSEIVRVLEKRRRGPQPPVPGNDITAHLSEGQSHENQHNGCQNVGRARPDTEILNSKNNISHSQAINKPTAMNLRERRKHSKREALDEGSDGEYSPVGGLESDTEADEPPSKRFKVKGKVLKLRRKRGRPRKNPARDPNTIRRHKKVVRHVCKICNAQFLHGRPFHRHLSSKHDAGATSCIHCKGQYENYAHWLHHNCEFAEKKLGSARVCERCKTWFNSLKKLKEHLLLVHEVGQLDPIHFCKFCDKGFVRRASLMAHLKVHANGQLVCERCGEFCETEELLSKHSETHRKSPSHGLKCDKCGTVFFRKQQYEQHMAGHEKYDCSMCKEVFSRKKLLLKHIRDFHNIKLPAEEKRHECSKCGRKFHRPGQLEIHLRVHSGEKPIECKTCKMFFKSNKALWKHKQTHTHLIREGELPQERDHLCSICGKSYFRKHALQRHMRYHNEIKPFNCPHCKYQCRDNNNMKRHIQLHFSEKQFVCETCGASFHAKKTLETHHIYKHSNERTHQCNVCPMSFKTPNSLRRHQVTHAKVRPYKCHTCSLGFNRQYNLRRHLRSVHGSDDTLPPINRVKVLDMSSDEEQTETIMDIPVQNTRTAITDTSNIPDGNSSLDKKILTVSQIMQVKNEVNEKVTPAVGNRTAGIGGGGTIAIGATIGTGGVIGTAGTIGTDPLISAPSIRLTVPQVHRMIQPHPQPPPAQHVLITSSLPTFPPVPEPQDLTTVNSLRFLSGGILEPQTRVVAHYPTPTPFITLTAPNVSTCTDNVSKTENKTQPDDNVGGNKSAPTYIPALTGPNIAGPRMGVGQRLLYTAQGDLYTAIAAGGNIIHLITDPTMGNTVNNDSKSTK